MTGFKIGCSGYYYPEWKGKFYPEDLGTSKWLNYYSSVFDSVELNGTFYRQPKIENLKKYARMTPGDFKFSAKASRYITHILKMKDAKAFVLEFSALLEKGLEEKFDKLLFQLPPTFAYSPENLDHVFDTVPPSSRNVIEFRHSSWWNEKVFKQFSQSGIIFCNVDYPGLQPEFVATGSKSYLRLHGVPELFKSSYSLDKLKMFVKNIPGTVESCNIYFNNTAANAAYENASTFATLIDRKYSGVK
ncbi:MAG: DUF72 domain-containing protein [Bacteroidota bacterium]|nr:DUF72 domain-containing protein [Bacteroidota bacterium]